MAQQTQGLAGSLQDPAAGPRPITLEEYRRRNPTRLSPPEPQAATNRGGYRATTTKAIPDLHRLADLALTMEERRKFLDEAKQLRRALRIQIAARRKASKCNATVPGHPGH